MEDLVRQIKADPDGIHRCPSCNKEVPNERYFLVGNIMCCGCSAQPKKLYGVMEYSEKAVGILVMTEDENVFKELKKPANKRR
jgi:hypothetical protein